MRLYYDTRTDQFVNVAGTQDALTQILVKRGAYQRVEIQFGYSPNGQSPVTVVEQPQFTVQQLAGTAEIIIAIKENGKYEQDPPLAIESTWVWDATNEVYVLELNTDTATMNAALSHDGYGTPFTFTADAGTDVFTATGHGLSDGDVVHVSTTGTLPAGLSANTDYFIISSTANTFQLSLTTGGSAVDVTDAGSGTHSATQNPDDTNDVASLDDAMFGIAWRETASDGWRKNLNPITAVVYHDEVNTSEGDAVVANQPNNGGRWSTSTTDATWAEIMAQGLNDGDSYAFRVMLAARSDAGVSSLWEFKGMVERDGSTTAFVGVPTKQVLAADAGAATWDADVDDDNANNQLSVDVKGAAATNINWRALVELLKVSE